MKFAFNPLIALSMVFIGYAAFAFIAGSMNPLATSRRVNRRRVLLIAKIVGASLAMSWLVTIPLRETSILRAILASSLVAVAFLCFLAVAAATFLAIRYLFRSKPKRNRFTGEVDESRKEQGHSRSHTTDKTNVRQSAYSHKATTATRPPENFKTLTADRTSSDVYKQLNLLDSQIRSHNLGGSPHRHDKIPTSRLISSDDSTQPQTAAEPLLTELRNNLKQIAVHDAGPAKAGLHATRFELVSQIEEVSAQNLRLQKLVIAQRARLESTREALQQAKATGWKAINAAKAATDARNTAIKIARRERAEKVKFEKQARRSSLMLQNALSHLPADHQRNTEKPKHREANSPELVS